MTLPTLPSFSVEDLGILEALSETLHVDRLTLDQGYLVIVTFTQLSDVALSK